MSEVLNLTDAVREYLSLKKQEKALTARIGVLRDFIHPLAIAAGANIEKPLITEAGRAYDEVANISTYKVTGQGGIMALFDNHPELDKAKFLSVKAAEVKKLPAPLLAKLAVSVEDQHKLQVKPG